MEDRVGSTCHCHALRQAARRATALYDAALAPYGVRISQFAILVRLERSGSMGVRALAEALVLDRTTLGRALRPLEREGLVASGAGAGDGRVRLLAITAAGAALVGRAMPAWRAAQATYEGRVGAGAPGLRRELDRVTAVLGG